MVNKSSKSNLCYIDSSGCDPILSPAGVRRPGCAVRGDRHTAVTSGMLQIAACRFLFKERDR